MSITNSQKGGDLLSGSEIRERILSADLHIWKVADAFGCTDATFSRKLRHDFSKEDSEKILAIIEELRSERA